MSLDKVELLKKAVTQKQLTRDTVSAQFCSDWLKSQIEILFDENEKLTAALGWKKTDRKDLPQSYDKMKHSQAFMEELVTMLKEEWIKATDKLKVAEGALATIESLEPKSSDYAEIRKWDRVTARDALAKIREESV